MVQLQARGAAEAEFVICDQTIELLFKLWKMQGEWDCVAGRPAGRVMGELYAKLIGMVVFGYLTAPVRLAQEQELSPARAWQVWQRQIEKVAGARRDGRGLCWVLCQLYTLWEQLGSKDQRPNRPTTFARLKNAAPPQTVLRLIPLAQSPIRAIIRASPVPLLVKSLT